MLEVIGRGGMGLVLRALDETLNRIVAIKVMAPQLAASATARKRFVREARATAAIRNEHVINIYAVEESQAESHSLPYLVMEYIDGISLQDYRPQGPLDSRRSCASASRRRPAWRLPMLRASSTATSAEIAERRPAR